MDSSEKIHFKDWLLLGLFSLILFGFAGFSGRPLTMHEARLPQTSREMLWHHQWLLPTSGGRPWLERPPLPHWLVIWVMKLFGHDDKVWIVRLPSAGMGTLTVLLTAFIASRCFGRTVGLVSGYLLATSFKFYQYASLAEDDIFLAALVAAAAAFFTVAESSSSSLSRVKWYGFVSGRSWLIFGFFAVLGLSNITKGPLLGIVILGGPVGVYLMIRSLMERSFQPLLRYAWLWGWLVLIGLTFAWPFWAYHKIPDVLENWKYDYLGRMSGVYTAINEPWWYYPPKLAIGLLPWMPFALLGLVVGGVLIRPRRKTSHVSVFEESASNVGNVLSYQTRVSRSVWERFSDSVINHRGLRGRVDSPSAGRFIWVLCWAIVPLIVLSIPQGKHDHYLVPFLAPWAMHSALGMVLVGGWLGAGRRTMTVVMILLCLGFCAGEAFIAPGTDHTVDDTAFLLRSRQEVPGKAPLFIDGKLGPPGNLDFFRIQFYSRPDAVLLHNLSFLRDEKITAPVVYVIARQRDLAFLNLLGDVQQIDQSPKSHDMEKPVGRFTLYRLTYFPGVRRYPAPTVITSLQAMERAPGPWCGPPIQ